MPQIDYSVLHKEPHQDYYVYIYVDLRKPGPYMYRGLPLSFLYEPFLVGKGRQRRYTGTNQRTSRFLEMIKDIKQFSNLPYSAFVIKVATGLNNVEALLLESMFIRHIGRMDRRAGPLINLSNGGEGRRTRPLRSITERFWSHVNKDGPIPVHRPDLGPCWLWTARLNEKGYGAFHGPIKIISAHRFAWVLAHGEIPECNSNGEKIQVLHKCDVPNCIRESHLFLGTHDDNMKDMNRKLRAIKHEGSQCKQAKLTEEQVAEIRRRVPLGTRGIYRRIAEEFGVHSSNISVIMRNKGWLFKQAKKREEVKVLL